MTKAKVTFTENITRIKALASLIIREGDEVRTHLTTEIDVLTRKIDGLQALLPMLAFPERYTFPVAIDALTAEALTEPISPTRIPSLREAEFSLISKHLQQWLNVMLVTFTEAYLQDGLSELAELDPRVIDDSEQAVTIQDLRHFDSVSAIAGELYRRWAGNFVSRGGPQLWIKRLTAMGASGFTPELGPLLEQLWGIRHVVVHQAGRANLEFVKRHPDLGVSVGDEVVLFSPEYVGAVRQFVDMTDLFLEGRGRQGRTQPSPTE